jgi:hypothetical protein
MRLLMWSATKPRWLGLCTARCCIANVAEAPACYNSNLLGMMLRFSKGSRSKTFKFDGGYYVIPASSSLFFNAKAVSQRKIAVSLVLQGQDSLSPRECSRSRRYPPGQRHCDCWDIADRRCQRCGREARRCRSPSRTPRRIVGSRRGGGARRKP